ncbi:MAG TPA: T9SS type A sorting domain-containing protein, partial [Bacteroidia bacterium]|nr:T9SS type A sorting domain-containing protein [Bacteroidia bacterium]
QYDGGVGAQFETNNSELVIEGASGGMNRDFNFSAGSTLSELTINRNATTIRLESALIVTDSIHMLDGTLRLMTGSTLTPGVGCVIYVEDGIFYVTGGIFDGALSYDVIYNGPTHLADAELTGTGLNNLTVDLFASASVLTLSNDVTVNGAFNLTRGKVELGVYEFEAAGTWNQVSGSAIMGTAVAVLHLHMTSVSGDTLWMDPNAKAVSDLVIETPVGASVVLGSEISIHGQVNFISGKFDIGQGALYVRPGAAVNGSDDTRYFITSDTGSVHQYVVLSAAAVIVPIGTAASYSPIGLHLTSSATPGYISVRAMDGVYTSGLSGSNMATWETVVDRTWVVYGEANMTMDMHISLRWGAANEANGFDRNNSFITHYDNGMWDTDTLGSAIAAPFNTFRLDRGPFTNGGAFAVADNSTALSVPEQPVTGFSLYPNPTLDFVTVNTGDEQPTYYLYELYDASGKLVNSFANSNSINYIDLANYEDGYYLLRITNLDKELVETKRIVKAGK